MKNYSKDVKSIRFLTPLEYILIFLLNISTLKQLVVTFIIVGEWKKCRQALLIGRYCIVLAFGCQNQ